MKNVSIIVILLLLVVVAVFAFRGDKEEQALENQTNQAAMMEHESAKMMAVEGTGSYSIDAAQSTVQWEGRKKLVKEWIDTGVVSVKSGSVEVVDGALTAGEIMVDMSTIVASTTGSGGGQDKLAGHLKSADFFDVENHPTASFKVTGVTMNEATSKYDVMGDITIKGKTEAVSFPASISMNEAGQIMIEGDLVLDRSKFDVRFGSESFFNDLGDNVIDDNFSLMFKLVANQG